MGLSFAIVSGVGMLSLAIFFGVKNNDPSVLNTITTECNEAITSSPFNDVTVQQLQDACVSDNEYYLTRSVIWTSIRAAIQVLPFKNNLT